jgi:hypothetical protein
MACADIVPLLHDDSNRLDGKGRELMLSLSLMDAARETFHRHSFLRLWAGWLDTGWFGAFRNMMGPGPALNGNEAWSGRAVHGATGILALMFWGQGFDDSRFSRSAASLTELGEINPSKCIIALPLNIGIYVIG